MNLGVHSAGSFGTSRAAPSGAGFFTSPNNYAGRLGYRFDADGFGSGSAPTTDDFVLPGWRVLFAFVQYSLIELELALTTGTPEERFVVGYRTGSASGPTTNLNNAGRRARFDIPFVSSVDASSGSNLVAQWRGATSEIRVDQTVSFDVSSKVVRIDVTLTNVGSGNACMQATTTFVSYLTHVCMLIVFLFCFNFNSTPTDCSTVSEICSTVL